MKLEDFGFQPVMGKEYVVSFTKDGELLSTSIYNGSALPTVAFPDNAVIVFTVTDKETGKQLMHSEFISYNGKLYKSVFNLPLKNEGTNKNANVYIKELHYDLTTGSVLIQVQGFKGDKYNLTVSDSTAKHKVLAMPITLEDDMYYSIPTELVQGNTFEVLLQDEYGKSIDIQEFTAPISTDWRFTPTVEDGTLVLDENTVPTEQQEEQAVPEQIDQTTGNPTLQNEVPQEGVITEEVVENDSFLPASLAPYEKPIIFGSIGLIVLLLLILIIRIFKRKKSVKLEPLQDDFEEELEDEEFEEEIEEVEEVEELEEEEEKADKKKKKDKKPKKPPHLKSPF